MNGPRRVSVGTWYISKPYTSRLCTCMDPLGPRLQVLSFGIWAVDTELVGVAQGPSSSHAENRLDSDRNLLSVSLFWGNSA